MKLVGLLWRESPRPGLVDEQVDLVHGGGNGRPYCGAEVNGKGKGAPAECGARFD